MRKLSKFLELASPHTSAGLVTIEKPRLKSIDLKIPSKVTKK